MVNNWALLEQRMDSFWIWAPVSSTQSTPVSRFLEMHQEHVSSLFRNESRLAAVKPCTCGHLRGSQRNAGLNKLRKSAFFPDCKHDSQTEAAVRKLLTCWQKADSFILLSLYSALHWQASDGPPTKKSLPKLKRRQQTSARAHPPRVWNQHQGNAAAASVSQGDSKKTARSLPLARSVSHYAAETGLGSAWFPAEVKSTARS